MYICVFTNLLYFNNFTFLIGARTHVSGVRLVVRRQEFRCDPQYNNSRKTNHLIIIRLETLTPIML
jgi:hypothetical protein